MAKTTETADTTTATPSLISALIAEAFGTFLLVFGTIGTAIFTGDAFKVALAIGLTVLIGIFSVGHISGGHFNPAVTLGLTLAGRFGWSRVWQYVVAQLVGAVLAASILFLIATTAADGFAREAAKGGFASNGFGEHSGLEVGLIGVIVTEVLITAVFLWVILSVTDSRNSTAFAGIIIGLTLTLLHFVAIPIDNASLNPARSIATAIYGGPDALAQLIVFIIAPLLGAAIAGLTYKLLFAREVTA